MSQCEVFWPLKLNSKVLRVPTNSQVPILGVRESSSHSSKVGLWQVESIVNQGHVIILDDKGYNQINIKSFNRSFPKQIKI
jgi:hypothetical protein